MSIRVLTTRDTLANDYAALGPNGAVFTADPGTGGNATNEVTGGSPAYARKSWGWSTSTGGAGQVTGSATFDIPAGVTVAYVGTAASSIAGTNDIKDNVAVTNQTFASQGTYTVNATFTQG